MTQDEFVDALRQYARDAAAKQTLAAISNPPGRRPAADLVALAQWLNALPPDDADAVRRVADLVAHSAVFGVLAILDGARAIEPPGAKGTFELVHISPQGVRSTLASPSLSSLHDLL